MYETTDVIKIDIEYDIVNIFNAFLKYYLH